MNVRITPRDAPQRTDLYGGIQRVTANGKVLELRSRHGRTRIPLRRVMEIRLDEEPGDYW